MNFKIEPMQVVIPMTGTGRRFLDAGYRQPKPLLDVGGKPVIAHLVEKFPKESRFVFICNEEHLRKTSLRKVLLGLGVRCRIVPLAPHKLGPVYAVLKASKQIDDSLPTMVNYCDFSFSWDPDHFKNFFMRTQCDGAILSYRGFHPHYLGPTMYAYSKTCKGMVSEVKEKECFTDNRENEYASSGSYFFKNGKLVKKYFKKAIEENLSLNGEFYVSLVYNLLIRDSLQVRVYEIPFFLQWGTPEDLEDYLYWHRLFLHFAGSEVKPRGKSGLQLLMPMAGIGKRFQVEGYPPKPLCAVLGKPMFQTAIDYLPCSDQRPVFVMRSDIAKEIRNLRPDSVSVVLDSETEGQADSCRRARNDLDPEKALLVSSCDHGLLWDSNRWKRMLRSKPDVVVFTQTGYPETRRNPKSYAYVVPQEKSSKIKTVSVKIPVSAKPQKDRVLVGTFYFKKTKIMLDQIEKLIQSNQRVNGEFYLDSIVNGCIDCGLDVRYFDADGYCCWGTPGALKEFNYWHRYFMGAQ